MAAMRPHGTFFFIVSHEELHLCGLKERVFFRVEERFPVDQQRRDPLVIVFVNFPLELDEPVHFRR